VSGSLPIRRGPVLAVLFAGVLIGALDISIVGPALPAIGTAFEVDSRALAWVFNSYVLFYLIGAPLLGKLSDRHGRRAVYVTSLALFACGSLLIAMAAQFHVLLLGRVIQAIGAGGLFPIASAVIGDSFPPERRGRALGLIGAVFGVAFLLGPLLGGVLLRFSWHWLFLINLPLVVVLIPLAWTWLPAQQRTGQAPFDVAGACALVLMLGGFAWVLTQIDPASPGASLLRPSVVLAFGFAFAAAPWFWFAERRAADPILPPVLLQAPQLRLVGAIAAATGLVEAGMVFLPTIAVVGLGVSAADASLMMLPLVLALIVGAPTAGQLLDRVGARRVIQAGLLLTTAGLAAFAWLAIGRSQFYVAGITIGLGLSGLLGAPLRAVMLREAGERYRGAGQGLLTLWLSAGRMAGAAVVGALAASATQALEGFQAAMMMLASVTALALLVSFRLRFDAPAARLQGSHR
jgi:MFS family permease